MVTALGLPKEEPPAPSRSEVLARYRHLREISKRHLADTMKFLSPDAILHHARRLGLASGKTFILDSMDEIILARRSCGPHRSRWPFPGDRSLRQIDTVCARIR
jgi:hypothetical protein